MRRIVVAIYIDPDFYPPTINAILNFAELYDEVVVVTRNHSLSDFNYPSNVVLKKIGKFMSVRESAEVSTFQKFSSFYRFTKTLVSACRQKGTEMLVLYDPFPLFSYFVSRKFLSKKIKVWYHNHDMPDMTRLSRFTLGGMAGRYEKNAMRHIDYFSLPSPDRTRFYPGLKPGLDAFIIPNYPSLKVYTAQNLSIKKQGDDLRIIFQGFIGKGHALEEIVDLLNDQIKGKQLKLILKGSVKKEYVEQLNAQAESKDVSQQVEWVGIGPYAELPKLTASCHMGIGVHMNTDNVSKTLGTASNKIYEYAACGLPVILYDSEQFTKYLQKYPWAFFTDGTRESLKNILIQIADNYDVYSEAARESFAGQLNFEYVFLPVLDKIREAEKS
ncbi:glycosyltransferase [Ferruginibacter sp. HRS2-29]|uniref:glycosyltransferase n=1 Tax=Ferruginibacter sp. HRS2-29 TaxID=2487334 RepID=UPI0020CDBAB2|nr:glycosyltransferase [Ferruginibacter sp. HRS2-29]MCP9751928.1 glycosyltransferase [Ferruginibacter sp. HRS2-29]